ncbi:hypothetical protein [Rheinheimera mesophila]|uniref:hypothetical protein n=1 Tax=Rheinheimera mesophila TaxID=1547515 RepID=UPI000AEACE20|nr:hypothetical protein [Rheinheimera mesophila]
MFKGIKNYSILHKFTVLGGFVGLSIDLFFDCFPLFTGMSMLVLALVTYVLLDK